ncbi:MAG: N-acetylmuramoyl-L-alanine amidase family protein [Verrucomicrobiota bacterium]
MSSRRILVCLTLGLLFALAAEARTANINGTTYISLDIIAARLGMEARETERDEVAELRSQWTQMKFKRNRKAFMLNGHTVHLAWPVALSRGQLFISEIDYEKNLQPLLTPQVFAEQTPRLYRIVIDPGHGGKDPGAENQRIGTNEKTLALAVAHRLKAELERYGYQVLLTREDDHFLELNKRPAFANQVEADLFISLHFNAETSRTVRGIETFIFTPLNAPSTARNSLHWTDKKTYPGNDNDVWSTMAGFYMQRALTRHTGEPDRGLKRARFAVLRDAAVPAMLVELGFISTDSTARAAQSAAQQQQWVKAMVAGILDYQKTLDRLRGR